VETTHKALIRSRVNQTPETIKKLLKSKVNPTEIRVGITSLKLLRDGRVMTEANSKKDIEIRVGIPSLKLLRDGRVMIEQISRKT
jgi:hypothetical protein